MKTWMQKLLSQLDYDFASESEKGKATKAAPKISEDRATILYLIDLLNKNLIDIDTHPSRRVREALDEFTRDLLKADKTQAEDVLFRFRQFYSAYRVAETSYIRKSFEDFKGIVWNFVEQLSDDAHSEQSEDKSINESLQQLKEAVETDSIDLLRAKSREFINSYVELHAKKENRRTKRMKNVKKNLDLVKKQLLEADRSMNLDHLTKAFNRRSFDERMKQQKQVFDVSNVPVSILLMDIDFFKKVNDTYGHDVGDFVLKECVRILREVFTRDQDVVARIGGEEFCVILPEHAVEHAIKRAEDAMAKIRKEVFVHEGTELRFTVSMGIAQLLSGETTDQWLKRADLALYNSKQTGRNKWTLAEHPGLIRVA